MKKKHYSDHFIKFDVIRLLQLLRRSLSHLHLRLSQGDLDPASITS